MTIRFTRAHNFTNGTPPSLVMEHVLAERQRAHDKHKNSPAGSREVAPWDDPLWAPIVGEEYGEVCKVINEMGSDPSVTTTKNRLYTELIQLAAMATAWADAVIEVVHVHQWTEPWYDANLVQDRHYCPVCKTEAVVPENVVSPPTKTPTDPRCRICDRDNRNGTHDALESTHHLGHSFEATS